VYQRPYGAKLLPYLTTRDGASEPSSTVTTLACIRRRPASSPSAGIARRPASTASSSAVRAWSPAGERIVQP
jgi:hypothetical protein